MKVQEKPLRATAAAVKAKASPSALKAWPTF